MLDYLKALPRVIFKKGLPIQLIYFITTRCNSNCIHCFLKGSLNTKTDILKLDEIEKIAKGLPGLLSLSLTGGEPFLREELPEIAKIFYNKTKFRNLVIISNGLDIDNILPYTQNILSNCPRANVFIGISFDGLEDTHNSVRGVKEGFSRTKETFLGLKELKRRYKNLSVGTCTTCSSYNQKELLTLYDFLRSLEPDGIGINLMRGRNWRQSINSIDIDNYRHFSERKIEDWRKDHLGYSNIWFNKLLYAKEKIQCNLIESVYSKRRYITPCYAGRLLAIMRETGEVYPCEMIEESMGNIRDFNYNFRKLWSGRLSRLVRNDITKSRCFCTYECAMTTNIFFNPRYYYKLLKEALSRV